MNMVHCWNDVDRGKWKYSEKNLPQSHVVHLNSHIDSANCGERPFINLLKPSGNFTYHQV
jgi:hypothetical protein